MEESKYCGRLLEEGEISRSACAKMANHTGCNKIMWLQGYFGSGILTENSASADNNYLKRLESKKLLSSIEKAGLLSKAEKAGLTLSRVGVFMPSCPLQRLHDKAKLTCILQGSNVAFLHSIALSCPGCLQIEQSKLLSTVERLGLLTIAERLLVTDPGRVTALSIPFFLLSVGKQGLANLWQYQSLTLCCSEGNFYLVHIARYQDVAQQPCLQLYVDSYSQKVCYQACLTPFWLCRSADRVPSR